MAKRAKRSEGEGNFIWSDDEVELLLDVVYAFKCNKEADGYDWESIKAKYDIIRALFLERYPVFLRAFKRKETSNRLVAKIKALQLKYRSALDSG